MKGRKMWKLLLGISSALRAQFGGFILPSPEKAVITGDPTRAAHFAATVISVAPRAPISEEMLKRVFV